MTEETRPHPKDASPRHGVWARSSECTRRSNKNLHRKENEDGTVITGDVTEELWKKHSGGKNVPGSVGALVALAVSTLILLINPVSDLFYYGAVIFVLASLMFTLVELIKYYNVLATRRLPQFDNYKGGNDNA